MAVVVIVVVALNTDLHKRQNGLNLGPTCIHTPLYVHTYIDVSIEREREREKQRDREGDREPSTLA